ncbi:hypothetical protein [Muriicola marianensis]|uniref:Lipoprotein n=1 Tax=Muriicola marianensis TaxID=1324801 RepID=A0ABQ1QUP5_9FLAO|nr:hypothetical protein [Muriicola marianensis]GGD45966.1 hypothetical protein GCM10011361_11160 [Muriicola marianensis]
MKTRRLIFVLGVFLLNSCIVKSLFPFYTKDSISFESKFLGSWHDDRDNSCLVISFGDRYLIDKNVSSPENLSPENLEEYNKYKDGYYVELNDEGRIATFVAMPFKVREQLFLDFSLLDVEMKTINPVATGHFVGMHTLAKLEFSNDYNSANLLWFSEEKLVQLLEEDRIKIKHERTGVDNTGYLLTASSDELERFISKYMDSDVEDKWEGESIQYYFKR